MVGNTAGCSSPEASPCSTAAATSPAGRPAAPAASSRWPPPANSSPARSTPGRSARLPAAHHGWTAADTIATTQANTVTAPGSAPPSGTTTAAWSTSSIAGIDTATNPMKTRSRSAVRTPATAPRPAGTRGARRSRENRDAASSHSPADVSATSQ